MRITTAFKAATVALVVLAAAAPTIAQESPGQTRGLSGDIDRDPIIFELDFGGGSLESFADALRDAAGDSPMNIVLGPEAIGLPVPPIRLQYVDAFMALRSASQSSRTMPVVSADRRSFVWTVDRIHGDGAPVYTIEVHEVHTGGEAGSRSTAQLHTAVHSISNLTSGSGAMSADDVLSAIKLALDMDGSSDAKLSYHEETGLLFARVNNDQAHAIEMTIVNLGRSLKARVSREQQAPLDRVLDEVGADDVEELVAKVHEADTLRQSFHEMRMHISQLETRIADLQAELAAARRR